MSENTPGAETLHGATADKHTIDTPEQTVLEFAVAGIGSRFLALALDTLIQMAVGLALIFMSIFIGAGLAAYFPKSAIWYLALAGLMIFALYFGYFAFFEAMWNGQTPGKRIIRLRVIHESGRPITAAEAVGRNLLRIVDQMPGFYAVGIVSVLLSAQNKRLGDYVAGSIVVQERTLEEVRPAWQAATQSGEAGTAYGGAGLSAEEFGLIETFLNRREALEGEVRERMAREILRRIKPKLTMAGGEQIGAEKLLEQVAAECRAKARFS
ncbi:MAG: RDD family protein [Acidobacteriia bacterium]|nr:RDD family protein [Terriglobia bacterium]